MVASLESCPPSKKTEIAFVGLRYGWMPAVIFLLSFFVLPAFLLAVRSFMDPEFTVQNYQRIMDRPVYLGVLAITFKIATLVTVIATVLGYPYAYALFRLRGRMKLFLVAIVLVPFWTSFVVRTFAFMSLLGRHGVVNDVLVASGLAPHPFRLVYNLSGVVIGTTYMLLPYMILSLYIVMDRVDPGLISAAMSLGAGPERAFFSTILPLSIPGFLVGASTVFVLSLGLFVTPALLGGRREQTLAMLIEGQVNETLNWGFAAALSVFLVMASFLFIGFVWTVVRGIGIQLHRLRENG